MLLALVNLAEGTFYNNSDTPNLYIGRSGLMTAGTLVIVEIDNNYDSS